MTAEWTDADIRRFYRAAVPSKFQSVLPFDDFRANLLKRLEEGSITSEMLISLLHLMNGVAEYLSSVANEIWLARQSVDRSDIRKLKDQAVVVLGKDTGRGLKTLKRIGKELVKQGYEPIFVKEQKILPPSVSPEEKVKALTLLSRFAVMEDTLPSGHIVEFEYCKNNRVILAILRKRGRGSTWMIGDADLVDVNYIKRFEYDDKTFEDVLRAVVFWAEGILKKRVDAYEKYFPWRRNDKD